MKAMSPLRAEFRYLIAFVVLYAKRSTGMFKYIADIVHISDSIDRLVLRIRNNYCADTAQCP